jgi:hypothetical protein
VLPIIPRAALLYAIAGHSGRDSVPLSMSSLTASGNSGVTPSPDVTHFDESFLADSQCVTPRHRFSLFLTNRTHTASVERSYIAENLER